MLLHFVVVVFLYAYYSESKALLDSCGQHGRNIRSQYLTISVVRKTVVSQYKFIHTMQLSVYRYEINMHVDYFVFLNCVTKF